MSNRSQDLEMFAVCDPRVNILNDLRAARTRREAQWATWQMDRSWPAQSPVRMTVECMSVGAARAKSLPWTLGAAGFMALGVAGAGLLAVGIERGLL